MIHIKANADKDGKYIGNTIPFLFSEISTIFKYVLMVYMPCQSVLQYVESHGKLIARTPVFWHRVCVDVPPCTDVQIRGWETRST